MLSDLIPNALRPAKPVGGHGASAPRVSGVSDDAIVPVTEHISGDVIPYRGTETHGVDAGNVSYVDPRGELRHSVDVVVDPASHPVTPVLVKVVKHDSTEYTDWRVVSTLASAMPIALMQRHRDRTYGRIINNGAATILIGKDAVMTSYNSYPIAAGQTYELHHTEAVWVTSIDGSTVDVRGIEEFKRG